jgi:hypothetical protein
VSDAAESGEDPQAWRYPVSVMTARIRPHPRHVRIGPCKQTAASPHLVKAIRRRGIRIILVVLYAGTDDYLQNFATEPEERDTPGFFYLRCVCMGVPPRAQSIVAATPRR